MNKDITTYFTSESVTEGHPDKVCDRISDAILDAIYEQDPLARVACETSITTDFVLVMGEISTTANVNYEDVVRKTLLEIGYDDESKGINYNTCEIKILLDQQSPDIAMGTNENVGGAGDQGMMFGYATNETPDYMPITMYYANKLVKKLDELRKSGRFPYLRPDGKAQVTFQFNNGIPTLVDTVVLSAQHSEDVDMKTLRKDLINNVIKEVIPQEFITDNTKFLVNPTGRFVVGGPQADSGLTGRKIIVDTYGGVAHHGGGAFSGKDCTKVDRSAAYMARYIAKNLVATKLLDKCEIQLSYAIGVKKPTSIYINTFGTCFIDECILIDAIKTVFDLTPQGIINKLDLRKPIYKKTSSYGHFGENVQNYSWEQLDKVNALKNTISKILFDK